MMYCSRCGKKVLETMRFCPFCGAEVIIPEQDEEKAAPDIQPQAEKAEPDIQPQAEKTSEPAPFSYSFEKLAEEAAKTPVHSEKPVEAPEAEAPETAPLSDLFMEGDKGGDEDDYDNFERSRRSKEAFYNDYKDEDDEDEDEDDDDYEYEDGFFSRNWKGLLVFILLLALVGGGVFFAMSDMGQEKLAQISYPLPFIRAEIYSKLGYEAYEDGDFAKAGGYYERALSRNPESFDAAQSAAKCYISSGDTARATEMLRKCVEIDPKSVEAYYSLMELYPDPITRPADISGILERGYAETGDARLSPN